MSLCRGGGWRQEAVLGAAANLSLTASPSSDYWFISIGNVPGVCGHRNNFVPVDTVRGEGLVRARGCVTGAMARQAGHVLAGM